MRQPVLIKLGAFVLLIAAGVAAYAPGLNGPFLFDDGGNFLRNPGVHMRALNWDSVLDAARSKVGVEYIHRPIPRVTFALNYYFGDQRFDRIAFKTTNLVIHLLNGGLVFWLSTLLIGRLRERRRVGETPLVRGHIWQWFPVVLAAVWTLHPIQLTSVLYAVQRMTSLAGVAVLLGLIIFVRGRVRVSHGQRLGFTLMVSGVFSGTLLGVMCKESAVLVPLFACLLEVFFFSWGELDGQRKLRLKVFYVVLVGAMVLAAVALLLAIPDLLLRLYAARTFTPWERLMTQSRVLFYYLGLLFYPNLREFSLYHDDFSLSTGLLDPATTVLSVLLLSAAVSVVVVTFKRRPIFAFAVLWFLVGHAIESTVLGLELVHEHRNYLPSFGVFFGAVFYAFVLVSKREDLRRLVAVAGIAVLVLLVFVTHTRASVWNSVEEIILFSVRHHPHSYRAQMQKGTVLEESGADVKSFYAAFHTAAMVNPHSGSPIMRLQRIVSGLIYDLNEAAMLPEPMEDRRPAEHWSDPLFIDLIYLHSLDERISQEFTRRLTSTPMNAEMMIALSEFQRCATTKTATCPPVDRIEEWLTVALEVEPMRPIQRAGLLLTHARLRAHLGDIKQAVEMVEEAFIQSNKEEVGFLIELAELFRLLHDYDNADRVVELIGVAVEKTGRRVSDYESLKKYLASERAEFETRQETAEQ